MFKMFVGIYLLTVYADPSTLPNDGFHPLLDIRLPSGSILQPIRPAALSTRTHLLGRVMDLLSGVLGQKAPEFMTAGGFSDSPHFMYSGWKKGGGGWFQLYQIGFGGIPARPHGDGMVRCTFFLLVLTFRSCVDFMSRFRLSLNCLILC